MHPPRGTWGAFDGVNAACSFTYNARKMHATLTTGWLRRLHRCLQKLYDYTIVIKTHWPTISDQQTKVLSSSSSYIGLALWQLGVNEAWLFECWAVPASALISVSDSWRRHCSNNCLLGTDCSLFLFSTRLWYNWVDAYNCLPEFPQKCYGGFIRRWGKITRPAGVVHSAVITLHVFRLNIDARDCLRTFSTSQTSDCCSWRGY